MEKVYVGIDISKETLDVAVCKKLQEDVDVTFQVENNIKGINKMISLCSNHGKELWFCFEHTGNYGLLLSSQLEALGKPYSAVPPLEIKRSLGMVRGKNDKVDAQRIATYAASHAYKLKPTQLVSKTLLKVKSLLTYRMQLSETIRRFKNSLKSHNITNSTIKIESIINGIEDNIKSLKEQIKAVEKEIMELIKSDDKLKKNFDKVTSVTGIGPIIAFNMLVHTNNFTLFDNPRKFNCYSGLAPFEHSSGTSISKKTKTSRLRNKRMKILLYNGANSAAQYDMQLRAYYKRKKEEGKPHQLIINNIACKLVYRVFAVVNREEPYVKFQ